MGYSSTLFSLLSAIPFQNFFDFLWYILWMPSGRWTNRNRVRLGKLRKAGPSLIQWCSHHLSQLNMGFQPNVMSYVMFFIFTLVGKHAYIQNKRRRKKTEDVLETRSKTSAADSPSGKRQKKRPNLSRVRLIALILSSTWKFPKSCSRIRHSSRTPMIRFFVKLRPSSLSVDWARAYGDTQKCTRHESVEEAVEMRWRSRAPASWAWARPTSVSGIWWSGIVLQAEQSKLPLDSPCRIMIMRFGSTDNVEQFGFGCIFLGGASKIQGWQKCGNWILEDFCFF